MTSWSRAECLTSCCCCCRRSRNSRNDCLLRGATDHAHQPSGIYTLLHYCRTTQQQASCIGRCSSGCLNPQSAATCISWLEWNPGPIRLCYVAAVLAMTIGSRLHTCWWSAHPCGHTRGLSHPQDLGHHQHQVEDVRPVLGPLRARAGSSACLQTQPAAAGRTAHRAQ